MRIRYAALVAVLAGSALTAQGAAPRLDSFRQADLKADLYFLGSDAMQGRLTNTPENRIASEWVKSRFERLGLAPAVPGYFQHYNLMTVTLGDRNAFEIVEGGAVTPIAHGEGYYTQRFSATAEAQGAGGVRRLRHRGAGPGLRRLPEHGPDRGRIVLVIDHEPGERDPNSPFDGVVTSDAGGALRKAQAAQARGAAGILYVSDVHNHPGAGRT